MATDLTAGAIPACYREVYQLCAGTGNVVSSETLSRILVKSGLPSHTISQIWTEADARPDAPLPRTKLYKMLALVALAQQGKQPSAKLLENFDGPQLPVPELGDLTSLTNADPAPPTYADLCRIDEIQVDLVPEKKGLFLKHVEYIVLSRRLSSSVRRRYTDFVLLREALLARFPYRLVPKLPPKKIVLGDGHFLEERRRALHRWLSLVSRHPVMHRDPALELFLSAHVEDVQTRLRDAGRRAPDEADSTARTADIAATHATFQRHRDEILGCQPLVARLEQLADSLAHRSQRYALEVSDLATQLEALGAGQRSGNVTAATGPGAWDSVKNAFRHIARELGAVSGRASAHADRGRAELAEQIVCLREVLSAHADLWERHEKAVAHDHARALSTLLALKKRQIHGATRNSDAEAASDLEAVMNRQEGVMASVEMRDAFALRCLHEETRLAHAHLELLAHVLATLVRGQARAHAELADAWKSVETKFVPQASQTSTGTNGQ